MEEIDDTIDWTKNPYEWWVVNDKPVLMAIPLQNGNAINLMAALNEAYNDLCNRNLDDCKMALDTLGAVIVAKSTGRIPELMEIITQSIIGDDMDAELQKLLEGGLDDES